jgi:hypothetical protein
MKFMLTWRVHPQARQETLKGFSQMSAEDDQHDTGSGVKMIGRWHDLAKMEGVAIFESDDAKAISSWALNWNPHLDITNLTPVLDDDEAREVGRSKG